MFPLQLVGDPVLFDVIFTDQPVLDYRDLARADKALQARFNGVLRERGILKSPAKIYPHLALTEEGLQQTETAITAAAAAVAA